MPDNASKTVDRFAEAAAKARVPVHEFKLWLIEHMDPEDYNPKTWSHWKTGLRPIPETYIIQFLHERLARTPDASTPEVSRGKNVRRGKQ